MTRIKNQTIPTRETFIGTIDLIATLQTRIRLLEAKRDKAIQRAQAGYQELIEQSEEQMQSLLAQADAYAQTHRDELFPGVEKTADTELASYGFRLHPPALKPLNRKWSASAILEAVKRAFAGRYIATEEKIQKDVLKAELNEQQLAAVGLRLEQAETFGVTPKVDDAITESVGA